MPHSRPAEDLGARWSSVAGSKPVVGAIGWVLAGGPASLLLFLLLHAMHARFYLGRWPVVYQDDPQSWLLTVHEYGLIAPAFYLCLFGIPVWMVGWAVLLALRVT